MAASSPLIGLLCGAVANVLLLVSPQLVKSFDFEFGFCIPGSVNCWDAIYSMPPLDEELVADMVNHPYETQSDSFYFVDNTLVMHNKASYKVRTRRSWR